MTTDNTEVTDNDSEEEIPEVEEEDGEIIELEPDDLEGEGEDDSDDTEGEEGTDEGEPESVVVTKPTGKDLLDMLGADEEAKTLLQSTLSRMLEDNARTQAAEADAAEFRKLIESGDMAAVGERIVERSRIQQAREQVTNEVLEAQFRPVYADIMAQPEMKALTAEEKLALDPAKFESDAHLVRALEGFIQNKRFEAKVEAEVAKRVAAASEAKTNKEVATKVSKRSVANVPASTGPVTGKLSSSDLIRNGLRAIFEPDGIDDDDN